MPTREERRGYRHRRRGDCRQQKPVFHESSIHERIGAERYAASPCVSIGMRTRTAPTRCLGTRGTEVADGTGKRQGEWKLVRRQGAGLQPVFEQSIAWEHKILC